MEKPIVFLSHSSRDKKGLSRLREMLIEKTGGTIDFFLSSDGQSIKVGRNWVHKVEEALKKAKIMFVFVTPNSIGSSWMLFESGFAYCKGIRVIPTGFLGVDITTLSPPLSLLEGFNIRSSDSLDNLIATLNEEFSHHHTARFTNSEFEELLSEGGALGISPLGQYAPFIERISIRVFESDGLMFTYDEILQKGKDALEADKIEFEQSSNCVSTFGLNIKADPGPNRYLEIEFESSLVSITFPIVEKLLKNVRDKGVEGIVMRFLFYDSVGCINEAFKLSAKLYGLPITFGPGGKIIYKDFEFTIQPQIRHIGTSYQYTGAILSVRFKINSLSIDSLRQLIHLLFDREILFIVESPHI